MKEKSIAKPIQWSTLLTVSALASFGMIGMTIIQALVYFIWPPPSFEPTFEAVKDWYEMLDSNALIGLLNLDLFMLLDYILNAFIVLGLYMVLKRHNESLMLIALLLGIAGIIMYYPSNPAFSMLTLSNLYTTATEIEKNLLISSGQTILAQFKGTAFVVSYLLIAISGLMMALVMLKSSVFSKLTALIGILFYTMNLIPASAGVVGFYLSFLSLFPMLLWLFLIGKVLLRIGGNALDEEKI